MKKSKRRCLIVGETTQPAEVERIQVLRWLASQLPEGILRFGRTCTGGSTLRLCQEFWSLGNNKPHLTSFNLWC